VSFLSFYTDDHGFPRFRAGDERYNPLGVFLTMEVTNSPTLGLDLLEMVDDVVHGRAESRQWDGEGFLARFSPDGVSMQNRFLDFQRGTYSLAEVREAAENYWSFIADMNGPEQVAKDLISWEQTWERTHPYRGRARALPA
jgi:hypothetical protein